MGSKNSTKVFNHNPWVFWLFLYLSSHSISFLFFDMRILKETVLILSSNLQILMSCTFKQRLLLQWNWAKSEGSICIRNQQHQLWVWSHSTCKVNWHLFFQLTTPFGFTSFSLTNNNRISCFYEIAMAVQFDSQLVWRYHNVKSWRKLRVLFGPRGPALVLGVL